MMNIEIQKSDVFRNVNSIDVKIVNSIDFELIFERGVNYPLGFKDEIFLKFFKKNVEKFNRLKFITFSPENSVDVTFLGQIKTLIDINIPLTKIQNLDFILSLPQLGFIGDFQDVLQSVYNMGELKRMVKYRKNIKMLMENFCITQ